MKKRTTKNGVECPRGTVPQHQIFCQNHLQVGFSLQGCVSSHKNKMLSCFKFFTNAGFHLIKEQIPKEAYNTVYCNLKCETLNKRKEEKKVCAYEIAWQITSVTQKNVPSAVVYYYRTWYVFLRDRRYMTTFNFIPNKTKSKTTT